MAIKLIALDLDGTLTNSQKVITPRTRQALMKAQEQGVILVLASGRPTLGIQALADELLIGEHGGYVLAFNGGKMTKWSDRSVVFEQILDENLVPELYEAATSHDFPILTYQGLGIASSVIDDEYVEHEAFINKLPVELYDDFLNQIVYPINKCLIVGVPERLALLEKELAKQMEGRMNIYRSSAFFLECVPMGIDKAASLQRLIDMLGIKREEVMACGDGYNDLSMIEFAGLGVAMENAAPEVKEKADYVTLSNEEDGVGVAVEKFVLI
ncbi:MAG: HAD family phosphatase [Bacteroidales bacterium]|nr:HAD family phosphatase [Candidatus Liminaster caballi]